MALGKAGIGQLLVLLGCGNDLVVTHQGPELLKTIIGGQGGLINIEVPGDKRDGRVFTDTDPIETGSSPGDLSCCFSIAKLVDECASTCVVSNKWSGGLGNHRLRLLLLR